MKVKHLMTPNVISITPDESAAVAARLLTHYNIGALPVCTAQGKLCGMVTDRDVVIRCVAANLDPGKTQVKQIMTRPVQTVTPDMEAGVAAHLMGSRQIRRLPVVNDGILCGMVSLGDIARQEDSVMDAADALQDITEGISIR